MARALWFGQGGGTLRLVDPQMLLVGLVSAETLRRDGLLSFCRKNASIGQHLWAMHL